jgi:3-oxoacyl-[acyl-carrier-protein] synthase-3
MAGILSIGWWVPQGRRSAQEIAGDYGLSLDAVRRLGLKSKTVPGEDDHPSTMGARATRRALEAAGLGPDDLDLLLFAGVTRDWPTPWIAAFGVLHELGAPRARGLDIASRCAGGIDALWLARTLVESGTYRTVAVCCADRYDHVMGPRHRAAELVTDAVYAAGAATAIVSAEAANDIVAFSHLTNPDLSAHTAGGPVAGGTRRPMDEAAVQDRLHLWRARLSIAKAEMIARYSAEADRHNYRRLFEQTGWDGVDFVACSPVIPGPQLEVLTEIGIDARATAFTIPGTIPHLGHIGPADLLLILGVATAVGRQVGPRVTLSVRTPVYSNALAIAARGDDLAIRVAGDGLDVNLWAAPPESPDHPRAPENAHENAHEKG